MARRTINVLMVAAECLPYAKVGGLADVVGALPKELATLNVKSSIVMPLYKSINRRTYTISKWQSRVKVLGLHKSYEVDIYKGILPASRVPVYFIAHPTFLTTQKVYPNGKNEIQKRFAFFSAAVVALMQLMPQAPDLVHLHDWHAGLLPWFMKKQGISLPTILTIHNLGSQGWWDMKQAATFFEDTSGLKTRRGQLNFLLNGIASVDHITTVSSNYSREILTSEYGEGLERVLIGRRKQLTGILNGIDYSVFSPEKDKNLFATYNHTHMKGKYKNKTKLQKQLGLNPIDKPLIGVVSRLYPQKGLDWVVDIMPDIIKQDTQFVILGTGDPKLEKKLKTLERKYPDSAAAVITYDAKLAQCIYAASDIFLIPSRFEPCGLTQMIAMRYGSVPVVRATGGLKDTVTNYQIKNSKPTGTGFVFTQPNTTALKQAITKALKLYTNQPKWKQLRTNCMKAEFSWKKSAGAYFKVYKKILYTKY